MFTDRQVYFRVLSYLKPYWPQLILSVALTLLYAISNVYVIPLVKDITEQLANKNLLYFSNHIVNAVLLFGVRLASKYGQMLVMTSVSNRVLIDLRMAVFSRLQALSMAFYSKWKGGDLTSRLFWDIDKVKEALFLNFENVLPNVITIVAVSGYLIYVNWRLAILTLVCVPFFLWIVTYFASKMKRVTGQIQRKTADITHIFQETVSNIKVIQAFTMEDKEISKFRFHHKKNYDSYMREAKYRAFQEPFVAVLQFAVFASVAWYGGYLVVQGAMTGPVLMSFFTGVVLLVDPITHLTSIYTTTHQSMACAERVFEILDEVPSVISPESPVSVAKVNGALEFDEVSFQYDGSEIPALDKVSFSVPAGDTVALVGLSGGGKSTLANMVPRFYDPNSGHVYLDGVDVKTMSLSELRSHIALVPQEPILFRGTVLENVRYGRPEASEDEVMQAMKQANAWDFVSQLANGMYQKIGDRGDTMSGGQKQRLAIARALLRDPQVLILDEATSALDSSSEQLVQDALQVLMKDRTTLMIAHRLSTISSVDMILVVEEGRIIEQGKHEELLAKGGRYSELYALQMEGKS